jgi:hypothetical protein
MLYATAAILYGALSVTLGKTARTSVAILLLGLVVSASIAHCFMGDVKSFRRCFLSMVLSVFGQCVWLLSNVVSDAKVKKDVQLLALYGTGLLLISTIDTIC